MAKKTFTAADLVGGLALDDAPATQAAATAAAAPRVDRPVRMVPLAAIDEDSPTQSREYTFDIEKYPEDQELLESVREHGVLTPVCVRPKSAGFGEEPRYQKVFGHRRIAAARAAGLAYVPALIARADDPVAALTVAENVGQRPLSSFERAQAIFLLARERTDLKTAGDLSKATGIPSPTIYMLRSAREKSPQALLEMFAAGTGARTVVALQPVFAAAPESDHAELARTLSSATHNQVERVANMVSSGHGALDAARLLVASSAKDVPVGDVMPQAAGEPPAQSRAGRAESSSGGFEAAMLARIAGVQEDVAQRVYSAMDTADTPDTAIAACLYIRRCGGSESQALQLARSAMGARAVATVISQYLKALQRSEALVGQLAGKDPDAAEFLGKVMGYDR